MLTDTLQAKDFVNSLEIPPFEPAFTLLAARFIDIRDKEGDGYINNGSLVSFVTNVSTQHKKDVLNSTLLAQLAADKKFGRGSNIMRWYGYYFEVLKNIGWGVQGRSEILYQAGKSTFTLNDAILQILGAIMSQNEVLVLQRTLEHLKNLADQDKRIILFEQALQGSEFGNFQICTATEAKDSLAIKLNAFYFKSEKPVKRILWVDFSSSALSLRYMINEATLHVDYYSTVRDTVEEKLGEHALTYINSIET